MARLRWELSDVTENALLSLAKWHLWVSVCVWILKKYPSQKMNILFFWIDRNGRLAVRQAKLTATTASRTAKLPLLLVFQTTSLIIGIFTSRSAFQTIGPFKLLPLPNLHFTRQKAFIENHQPKWPGPWFETFSSEPVPLPLSDRHLGPTRPRSAGSCHVCKCFPLPLFPSSLLFRLSLLWCSFQFHLLESPSVRIS